MPERGRRIGACPARRKVPFTLQGRAIYLLTTTAESFFERMRAERAQGPAPINRLVNSRPFAQRAQHLWSSGLTRQVKDETTACPYQRERPDGLNSVLSGALQRRARDHERRLCEMDARGSASELCNQPAQ